MAQLDVIWIAGHGGPDPGAVAGSVKEKDLTLKIAQKCHARAVALGLKSKLARNSDVGLDKDTASEMAAQSGAKLAIHIHINAGGGVGYEIYHSHRNRAILPLYIAEALKGAGNKPHGVGVLVKMSKTRPGEDYYRAMYCGNAEPIIIEYDYIDNPPRLALLQANLDKYAEATVQGVCRYLGKSYSKPQPVATNSTDVIDRLAKYVTIDVGYWKQVLAGKVNANPDYLRVLFERTLTKMK